MTGENFEEILEYECDNDKIRVTCDNLSTQWLDKNDLFMKRIEMDNINPVFPKEHILHEIKIKNILDDGICLLNKNKLVNSIKKFDEVLFYDSIYQDALINKSKALQRQGHYVKALRYYKKSVKAGFRDVEYYKTLLKQANSERDDFSKLKRNIYAGDEFFFNKEFEKAIESYDKALINPSKFKDKILFKLYNKKATALYNIKQYDEALNYFNESLKTKRNDYAIYAQGCCEYELDLNINDDFKDILNINKPQCLNQAVILNERELYKYSLNVCDMLMENHYTVDNFYCKLIDAKIHAMNRLSMDLDEINMLYDRICCKKYGEIN